MAQQVVQGLTAKGKTVEALGDFKIPVVGEPPDRRVAQLIF